MRFCLRPGAVNQDVRTRIGYCLATGIDSVQESASSIPGFAESRSIDPVALRDFVRTYTDAGLRLESVGLGQITEDVVLGRPEGEPDFERARRDVETLSQAGIRVIGAGLPIDKQPTAREDSEQLKRVADYYNRLCETAERADVRLTTHSPWPPSRRGWMWGMDRFAELFEAAPSRANGYLYDNAIHHMLGEDPAAAVRQFADRITYAHIRDVRKAKGEGAAGTGYDEVFPGTGELDFRAVLTAFRDIGYQGALCPEHFPVVPGDTKEAAATAYAVGYFRGVLACL